MTPEEISAATAGPIKPPPATSTAAALQSLEQVANVLAQLGADVAILDPALAELKNLPALVALIEKVTGAVIQVASGTSPLLTEMKAQLSQLPPKS